MSRQSCPECNSFDIVSDHAAGDMVCRNCGIVLEARSIDETSEWRTFSNESANDDPVRVGGPMNPLLSDGGLSTVVSGTGGQDRGWANRGSNPDRSLINAFKAIGNMAERAGLVATIRDRANEIYKKVEDMRSIRGRSQDSILAACLYVACRQEDKPRTFKEISAVANNASKKEIGRATKFIVRQLEDEMAKGTSASMGAVNAGDFMRRFCSHLNMDNNSIKAAIEVVKNTQALDTKTSRAPTSLAAVAIYIVSLLTDKKTTAKDIHNVTGVADGTIRSAYKELRPHASKIVPDWFANAKDIEGLPS